MKKYFTIIAFLIHFTPNSYSQLTVDTTLSPQQLANNFLGPGVTIFNVSLIGDTSMAASFTANGTNLGISNGIMLATGNVHFAIGPNVTNSAGTDMQLPGDSTLDTLANLFTPFPIYTHDACILEFDFIPQSSNISLRYVLGSEEYPDYVCSPYNDVFALFISGPGISVPTNIALIPGTSLNVSVNTINSGIPGAAYSAGPECDTTYSDLFVDNIGGPTIELDGFTVPIIAEATVQPGQTYHLRIMIADANDGVYDSGVFIEQGSLTSGIGNIKSEGNLSIFPNPVSDMITISDNISGMKINQALIYDAVGKLVLNINIDGSQSINVSSISNGVYFIKFITENKEILVNRFVKE